MDKISREIVGRLLRPDIIQDLIECVVTNCTGYTLSDSERIRVTTQEDLNLHLGFMESRSDKLDRFLRLYSPLYQVFG